MHYSKTILFLMKKRGTFIVVFFSYCFKVHIDTFNVEPAFIVQKYTKYLVFVNVKTGLFWDATFDIVALKGLTLLMFVLRIS